MVAISIKKVNGSYEIHASGHAEYADHGKDIVCSAASILLYTLVESIKTSDMKRAPFVVMQPGNTFISIEPKPEKEGEIKGILSVISVGFSLLEKNFPQNVCFSRGVG